LFQAFNGESSAQLIVQSNTLNISKKAKIYQLVIEIIVIWVLF